MQCIQNMPEKNITDEPIFNLQFESLWSVVEIENNCKRTAKCKSVGG